MTEIIFFGNGLLADYTKDILEKHFTIIFHARTRDDLAEVAKIKTAHPEAHGVLASFGIIIKKDILALFEPEGILNIHPSHLPDLRGASPIETAILRGDTKLSVSIMKLVEAMDAGPIYYQTTLDFSELLDPNVPASAAISAFLSHQKDTTPISSNTYAATIKKIIYQELASAGAEWLVANLDNLPAPTPQADEPTFCTKLDKTLSPLSPSTKTAAQLHREIIAYAIYPRSKIALGGHQTLILASHVAETGTKPILGITASDGRILNLDHVQPEGKRPMDAQSFKNGYLK